MDQDGEVIPKQDRYQRETLLVSEMIPPFLEYLRVECNRLPGTLERYEAYLRRFTRAVNDQPVTAIDADAIGLYKRKLLDGGLAPATMSATIGCVRSFLRYLRDVRGLAVYDAEKVRRPAVPNKAVEFLSKEEVQRFLDAIPTKTLTGLRDRALAEVLCATGMRISEALALNRDDIDWTKREAVITGKGRKQRRVYFTEDAVRWVQRYLTERWDEESAVFVTQGSSPERLPAHGSWRRFNRYARLAGLPKRVYPHMLRHTMATTLLANGCPIGHIRVLLGHAHLATTCRYYLGVLSDKEAKAAHTTYLSYEEDAAAIVESHEDVSQNGGPETLTEESE